MHYPKKDEIWRFKSTGERYIMLEDAKYIAQVNTIKMPCSCLPDYNDCPNYDVSPESLEIMWELEEPAPTTEIVYTLKPDGTWGKMEL